ncbi:hypothetical protein VP01_1937g4 [Puccinia sorghi]|uniref:Uncharacterized protein n=1 Tax=Puccinia sorghi TaxID=27349 RepID=A0A0L6VCW6_9BASI|nr:hypothetical protein VP01_1937g4 [Puccinia sorghi]
MVQIKEQEQQQQNKLEDPLLALKLCIRLLVFSGSLPTPDSFAQRFSSAHVSGQESLALYLKQVLGQMTTIL